MVHGCGKKWLGISYPSSWFRKEEEREGGHEGGGGMVLVNTNILFLSLSPFIAMESMGSEANSNPAIEFYLLLFFLRGFATDQNDFNFLIKSLLMVASALKATVHCIR
jgi:hypothetical protein